MTGLPPRDTLFSLRIVSMDYYMAKPVEGLDIAYSSFNGCAVHRAPVLRIFGSTPAGQKACLHLHKTFPYFYVPIDGDISLEQEQVDAFVHKLAVSIDRAMDLALGSRQYTQGQHVFSISVVRGKPFYGFHVSHTIFLKIFLYNPKYLSRVVRLLRSGAIMGRVFQPYEAHIPYQLQVFLDNNLYGMGFINLSDVHFRLPLPRSKTLSWDGAVEYDDSSRSSASPSFPTGIGGGYNVLTKLWLSSNVDVRHICQHVQKQSTCELEVDASMEDVMNRKELLSPPIDLAFHQDSKLVRSLACMWEENEQRKMEERAARPKNEDTPPYVSPERAIALPETPLQIKEAIQKIISQERPLAPQSNNTSSSSGNTTSSSTSASDLSKPNNNTHGLSSGMPSCSTNRQPQSVTELESLFGKLTPSLLSAATASKSTASSSASTGQSFAYLDYLPLSNDAEVVLEKTPFYGLGKNKERGGGTAASTATLQPPTPQEDFSTAAERIEQKENTYITFSQQHNSFICTPLPGPEINEELVLSQASDVEAGDILDWMQDHSDFSDHDDEDEESSSQQECNDILEASQTLNSKFGVELLAKSAALLKEAQENAKAARRVYEEEMELSSLSLGSSNQQSNKLLREQTNQRKEKEKEKDMNQVEMNDSFIEWLQNIPQFDGTGDDDDSSSPPHLHQVPPTNYRSTKGLKTMGVDAPKRSEIRTPPTVKHKSELTKLSRYCSIFHGKPSSTKTTNDQEGEGGGGKGDRSSKRGANDRVKSKSKKHSKRHPSEGDKRRHSSARKSGTDDVGDELRERDKRSSHSKRRSRSHPRPSAKDSAQSSKKHRSRSREKTSKKARREPSIPRRTNILSIRKDPPLPPPQNKNETANLSLIPQQTSHVESNHQTNVANNNDATNKEEDDMQIVIAPASVQQGALMTLAPSTPPLHRTYHRDEMATLHLGADEEALSFIPQSILTSDGSAAGPKRVPESPLSRVIPTFERGTRDLLRPPPTRQMALFQEATNTPHLTSSSPSSSASSSSSSAGVVVVVERSPPKPPPPSSASLVKSSLADTVIVPETQQDVSSVAGVDLLHPSSIVRAEEPMEVGAQAEFQAQSKTLQQQKRKRDAEVTTNSTTTARQQQPHKSKQQKKQKPETQTETNNKERQKKNEREEANLQRTERYERDERQQVERVVAATPEQHQISVVMTERPPPHPNLIVLESPPDSPLPHWEYHDDVSITPETMHRNEMNLKEGLDHRDDHSTFALWSARASPSVVDFIPQKRGKLQPLIRPSTATELLRFSSPGVVGLPAMTSSSFVLNKEPLHVVKTMVIDEADPLLHPTLTARPKRDAMEDSHKKDEHRESEGSLGNDASLRFSPVYLSSAPITGVENASSSFEEKTPPAPLMALSSSSSSLAKRYSFKYNKEPPSASSVEDWMQHSKGPLFEYPEPFYSNAKDAPQTAKVFAGVAFRVPTVDLSSVQEFDTRQIRTIAGCQHKSLKSFLAIATVEKEKRQQRNQHLYTPALPPPSRVEVERWLLKNAPRRSLAGTLTADEEHALAEGTVYHPPPPNASHQNNSKTTKTWKYLKPVEGQSDKFVAIPAATTDLEKAATTMLPPPPKQEASQKDGRRSIATSVLPEDQSQLEGATPANTADRFGFAVPMGFVQPRRQQYAALKKKSLPSSLSIHGQQHVHLISIEVHTNSRADLKPNPAFDSINAIFYCIRDDGDLLYNDLLGVLVYSPEDSLFSNHGLDCRIDVFNEEEALLNAFVKLVRRFDPDILVGYEVQARSLGYLIERANTLKINLCKELSRIQINSGEDHFAKQRDDWGFTHGSGINITGRIILNVWRILRSEVKLNNYSFENTVYHVLHKRVPHYPDSALTNWYNNGIATRWRTLQYWLERVQLNLQMLHQLDIIGRTSELARVFGVDFFSVLSRGSQYRVESMVLRLTKAQNYILISPSKAQVAQQNAPECLPLVMEPISKLHTSPVIVLDFQSLYPSIVIAYNYCYSTCLGRVTDSSCAPGAKAKVFGTSTLHLPAGLLGYLQHQIFVSPNEVMYVKKEVREGVLPRLLREILETRIMIKGAMKKAKKDPTLYKRLDSQQFGLKMIANVTYGYTSASFSGRMPCVELADSIVQTGRETLERAIRMVESNPDWNARVIYGDTDSMFVMLPGATKQAAFRIGKEIAAAVTASNPKPIKLQMEKVYFPCVLMTKKRYCGYKYETGEDGEEPVFEAKGIETVRRDTCPAVSKLLEKSLRMLFEDRDLSRVKLYLQRQWTKILTGRVSLQDFVFSKEVRLGTYSSKTAPPPAALVCTKKMAHDPRAEPRYGERVPYVVVCGGPKARLIDMVVSPHEFILNRNDYRLNSVYYITKQIIPALARAFNLVGADVRGWYLEMPRSVRNIKTSVGYHLQQDQQSNNHANKGMRIDQYYLSKRCAVCDKLTRPNAALCPDCLRDEQSSAFILQTRIRFLEREHAHLLSLCMHCSGIQDPSSIACDSLDCAVFFERTKVGKMLQSHHALRDLFS